MSEHNPFIVNKYFRLMRSIILFIVLFFPCCLVFPQSASTYQGGINGDLNLRAIGSLNPSSAGAVSFDNRYEGVQGSPRLFDTLFASLMLPRGDEKYIQFLSDLDIVNNNVLFLHPRTGVLMELSSDNIKELIISTDRGDIIFRTTGEISFEKTMKEDKFYQVLKDSPNQFIKVPDKLFIQAEYKGPYTIDRRFDEYRPENKYFIEGPGGVFYQVQLTRRSLIKLFPGKKEIISRNFSRAGKKSTEEELENLVVSLLEEF